jgi:hypothetical protein
MGYGPMSIIVWRTLPPPLDLVDRLRGPLYPLHPSTGPGPGWLVLEPDRNGLRGVVRHVKPGYA